MPILNKNWTGVEFDLNATVAKGLKLIGEAADNGANLVVFPELWFPGYLTTFSL
jgi:predicted amidohydrolase